MHPLWRGTLAQLVEQRTENPCVPGSIPGGTTFKVYKTLTDNSVEVFFYFKNLLLFLDGYFYLTNYCFLLNKNP